MLTIILRAALLAFILTLPAGMLPAGMPPAGAAPRKIVSLAPSITKNLYLLGMEDAVIAVTRYCPPGTTHKENIGTVLEPNIEKIVSLSPDLVIATKEGNNAGTVKKLASLGIPVFVMDSVNSYDDICRGFLALGTFVGKEERARAIIEDASRRLSVIRDKIRGRPLVTVFWEVGAQPLFTASRKSFVNEFIERAGGINIFADARSRYPRISREEVVRRDPDVIILVTMGDVTEDEKRSWERFKQVKAVRSGSIFTLKDSFFTDPTPPAIADGVETMAAVLQAVPPPGDL
ncbi:MAG: ABC transporter substrate-binding protein [Endomicrobiales bacterium]